MHGAADMETTRTEDDVFVFPASFAQRRLWFLDQFEPGSPYYNIPSAVRMAGRLNLTVLHRALNEVVRRHESLRTTFAAINAEPVQVISPDLTIPLPVTDLTHVPAQRREEEALQLAAHEAAKPFDLSTGPLLRVAALRLGPDDHIVLMTLHHIISDGWSMGVLLNEVTTLYAAFLEGRPSPLPELPLQYADYSEWQRNWLTGEVLESQLAWWKSGLPGDSPVLTLPADRPRPPLQSSKGANYSFDLPESLADGLRALARREQATLFMPLAAAFQLLLYRYSGQPQINLGTPIANRNRTEIESLIGLFANTLVIRSDLSGNPAFTELLRRVRDFTLGAYAHQDLPFEMLVEALQPERAMSYSPLFQAMLILQNAPMHARRLPGLTITQLDADSGTSTFDITLSITETASGLKAAIEYATDLFDAGTIARMAGHYRTLLEAAVADPRQRIRALRMLPESERRQLIRGPLSAPVPEVPVHRLIEAQAKRVPDAVAVLCPDCEPLTYSGLNRRANRLARFLGKQSVGPEVLTGICLERSPEMIVSVLAVLKAGGAYVPLDPLYPRERLAFMLSDFAPRLVLTSRASAGLLPPGAARVAVLEEIEAELAREEDTNLNGGAGPGNLAYVVYTSGSTGAPKGVMVCRHSVAAAYRGWHEAYALDSLTCHLQMANFSFDVFSGDFVRALCSGAKLVLCPREMLLDPPRLYALIRETGTDCAEFVPAVLRHLAGWLKQSGRDLNSFKLLVCGSDTWFLGEYDDIRRLCAPGARVVNSFGVTEATIDSSYFETRAEGRRGDLPVPIGRPFANTTLYILDALMQPVPVGVPGELYIGGPGVARGYLGKPELTAARFVPDPFSGAGGARLYRTGDLGRWLTDGNIEFLGRADTQLKIRGFRIEPGEIEAALNQHAEVRQAAVIARDGSSLAAYIVPQNGCAPRVGDLRRYLLDRLPEYMVPSAFFPLEDMPLTPNGKIDRAALPSLSPDVRAEDTYAAPRTPAEEMLAGIWADVLGIRPPGIHDNFFELGGHSLLATQVVSRIRDVFRLELPLRKVFEFQTIAQLAEQLQTLAGVAGPPLRPAPAGAPKVLSFAQQRLWFLDQLEPDSPFYNLSESVRLTGRLDIGALERSLNELARRHESLRTGFETVNGEPRVVVLPELVVRLEVEDASESDIVELASEAARQPFKISEPPLFRARLLRIAPEDHAVILIAHHIISDDWSTNVLIREMAVLYDAFAAGRPAALPDLPVQYSDFAAWQREYLGGAVREEQLAYWKERLRDCKSLLDLPTDRPRPPVQTYNGSYISVRLPASLTKELNEFSRREGATLFMTLLAAFDVLLMRYSGQSDISVGTPVAGRNRVETEGLIGFFINTLVLRTGLADDPSFRTLVGRCREAALGAYAHQDLPFEMLVDAIQPKRDLSHSPMFQVMFALQNAPSGIKELPGTGLRLSSIAAHSGTAKFDVTLFAGETGGEISLAFEYNTGLFDRSTIERMAAHFERLLEQLVADPLRPISRIAMLSPDERRALAGTAGATALDAACFHEMFEAQVRRTPDAVAVVFGAARLTYGELNARANQLAHALRRGGVGPDSLVGVSMRRSPELMIALLGVAKAGGAYVPVDPTYPPERIAWILGDSGASIVLTSLDYEALALESAEDPARAAGPENLAYVIYTSGSTGRPKGAMITHRGLVNYLTWCRLAYPLEEGRGTVVHSSIAFDLTVTALFPPLVAGRAVELLDDDVPIEALAACIAREGDFSLVKITPAHLQLLGQQLGPERAAGRTRAFIIGGENLLPDHIAFWQRHAPATSLVNEYGPTETVVGCCVYTSSAGERFVSAVPIGKPIINTRLYVLDERLEPAPIGVRGELFIGGAGVARGYFNRPELTAERFLPDPFSGAPGERMYRTGDLVRRRADGELECIGRIDDQLKIRGFRVEPGEVASALTEHPGVREAVAMPYGSRLVAYCVPVSAERPPAGELREWLKQRLPDYMVPSAFVWLDSLPLTPHGKVDRRALPAPEPPDERPRAGQAPRTAAEWQLASIWSAVLGVKNVSIDDNFFELGGDSILSIQVVARANAAGLRITPRQIFQNPALAALAAVSGTAEAVEADQGAVTGPVPLTPIQRWFFEQDLAEPNHYNQSVLLEVRRPLSREAVEHALNALAAHHDALRLRFHRTANGWEQINAASAAVPLDTGPDAVQAGLDISAGPLIRAAYFEPRRLLIAIHHLAVDGVSWRILLEDLARLCIGETVLPPKTSSYRQWALALEEYAQRPEVQGELEYWLEASAHDFRLPRDFEGAENGESSVRTVSVTFRIEHADNDILLAALWKTLADYSGRSSVTIAVEGHGREEIAENLDLSRTVGWFTSIYPLRLEAAPKEWPGGALQHVKEQLRRVPHGGIGYGVLRYLASDERLARRPEPEVSFNYLGRFDRGLEEAAGIFAPAANDRGPERSPRNRRDRLLDITAAFADGALHLDWNYSEEFHRRETIEQLAAAYLRALEELSAPGADFGWSRNDLDQMLAEIDTEGGAL